MVYEEVTRKRRVLHVLTLIAALLAATFLSYIMWYFTTLGEWVIFPLRILLFFTSFMINFQVFSLLVSVLGCSMGCIQSFPFTIHVSAHLQDNFSQ